MDFSNMRTTMLWGLILSLGLSLADAAKWGYVGEKGPTYWSELFPDACSGQAQSPIDIDTDKSVYDPGLKNFAIYYDPPLPGSKFTLLNNGHAIQVNTEGEFYVTNGGLGNLYKTAQFHFHWGHANHHGSEHTVNGKAAPIEMHIVNWNIDRYTSIGEAAVEPEGLAVLGILFEISKEDNLALEPLVAALMQVRDPDKKVNIEIPAVAMGNFLPRAPERYYRYSGSLTTPGCFESVTWTVFHEMQTISRRQLRVFRQVLKPKHSKHKRSLRDEARMVDAVFNELGIQDNALERSRFRRELQTKANGDNPTYTMAEEPVNSNDTTAHETPKETHTAHAKPEPISISGSGSGHTSTQAEKIRKQLVNNFRPVQPLNGRTVYRSFPFFEYPKAPEPVTQIVYVERERGKESYDGRRGNDASTSLPSLVSIACVFIAHKFLH